MILSRNSLLFLVKILLVTLLLAFAEQAGEYVSKNYIYKEEAYKNPPQRDFKPHLTIPPTTPTLTPTPTFSLTPYPEVVAHPSWGRIAYLNDGDIWTINADRSNNKRLTDDDYNKFHLNVSPDGSKIVYAVYPKYHREFSQDEHYQGYFSGLHVVEVNTGIVKELVPYTESQNHYPNWSTNSAYVSIWIGNGKGAKIFNAQTGAEILWLDGSVSPIVWIPKSNKISYIHKGKFIISDVTGSNSEIIAESANPSRWMFESPPVPQPPFWSASGRYATYYSEGKLMLYDIKSKTHILLSKSGHASMIDDVYPAAFLGSYTNDDTGLFILNYTMEDHIQLFDIASESWRTGPKLAARQIVAPDGSFIAGRIYDYNNQIAIIVISTLSDFSAKEHCRLEKPSNSYSVWPDIFAYSVGLRTWSPTSNSILTKSSDALQILNTESCDYYDLVKVAGRKEAVWFPH